MKKTHWFLLTCLSIFFISCNNGTDQPADGTNTPSIPFLSFSIISAHPHDTSFFTEGLEFYKNTLLESTGLAGKSKLVQVDPETGKILKQVKLDPKQFGEGITVLRDTLYQMTYRENTVNVYAAKDFKKIKELPLTGEGWGLTNDGKNLIASNGSSNLYFYEPSTFRLLRVQGVTENGNVVPNINELEYINGYIYANQWQYNYILKIKPDTGEVEAKIDVTDLVNKAKEKNPQSEVLNGIAYNPVSNKFYVTGKYWPEIYEIQFDR